MAQIKADLDVTKKCPCCSGGIITALMAQLILTQEDQTINLQYFWWQSMVSASIMSAKTTDPSFLVPFKVETPDFWAID